MPLLKCWSLLLVAITISSVPSCSAMNPCSAAKMWDSYREMVRVSCKNCDKYFHCKGNYNAVYQCGGVLKEFTANAISNMREWYQGGSSGSGAVDSAEDQAANRYGRSGGNCEARYLKSAGCAYKPSTKQCKW